MTQTADEAVLSAEEIGTSWTNKRPNFLIEPASILGDRRDTA